MARRVHIDFESASSADLKTVGVDVYAAHPSTRIWCMGWKFSGGHDAAVWRNEPGEAAPREVLEALANGATFVAHNVYFDFTIWNEIMHPRYGWPKLDVRQLDCTMARAAALGLPTDLATLSKVLQLSKQKDEAGGRVMKRLMKPRGVSDDLGFKWWNTADRMETLYAYCRDDVEAEAAVDAVLPPLDASERAIWEMDFEINKRGCGTDRTLIEALIKLVEFETQRLNNELCALTNGVAKRSSDTNGITKFLASRGVHTDGIAKDVVLEVLARKDLPADCRRVLEIRQSAGRASLAKLPRMISAAGPDGRLRGMFRYHGAGPGRWAGAGVQAQNFPRAVFHKDDDESDAIAAALIEVLLAPASAEMHCSLVRAIYGGEPLDAATKLLRSCLMAGE